MANLTWNGEAFEAHLHGAMLDRLRVACEILSGRAKKRISHPYPPASLKGESPHTRRYQQGLLGSVFYDVDEQTMEGIVGTNMIHGLYLEVGELDRPWLGPALDEARDTIKRIMTEPLPEHGSGGSGGHGESGEGSEG